tara:strand:+ start:241 stop:474 length:234 start_codon:yes stop_codon:yes gene_type:complete
MYPQFSLINKRRDNVVAFERDLNNPLNEGFIVFWKINRSKHKQFLFKKRLTTLSAQNKLINLQNQGWIKTCELDKVA